MEKVTIKQIYRGVQKTSKGEWPKIAIKTETHGDKWLSSFSVKETAGWKEGDTVEIDIEQRGEYLNFKLPGSSKPSTSMEDRVKWLENRVTDLEKTLRENILKDAKKVSDETYTAFDAKTSPEGD